MHALHDISENFIRLDMSLETMEEMYSLLSRFAIDISRDDMDMVDSLRYNFNNMIKMVSFEKADLDDGITERFLLLGHEHSDRVGVGARTFPRSAHNRSFEIQERSQTV